MGKLLGILVILSASVLSSGCTTLVICDFDGCVSSAYRAAQHGRPDSRNDYLDVRYRRAELDETEHVLADHDL